MGEGRAGVSKEFLLRGLLGTKDGRARALFNRGYLCIYLVVKERS
jgi:hypothetical protein